MVDGLGELDDATVVARLSRTGSRDERLGFGLEDLVVLVSPVLYIVLDQAVRKIVDDSLDGARRGLPGLLRRWRPRPPTPPLPELSAQQIAQIRDQFEALAKERGVPEDKIDRVGAAVAEVLSGGVDGDGDGPPDTPPVSDTPPV